MCIYVQECTKHSHQFRVEENWKKGNNGKLIKYSGRQIGLLHAELASLNNNKYCIKYKYVNAIGRHDCVGFVVT